MQVAARCVPMIKRGCAWKGLRCNWCKKSLRLGSVAYAHLRDCNQHGKDDGVAIDPRQREHGHPHELPSVPHVYAPGDAVARAEKGHDIDCCDKIDHCRRGAAQRGHRRAELEEERVVHGRHGREHTDRPAARKRRQPVRHVLAREQSGPHTLGLLLAHCDDVLEDWRRHVNGEEHEESNSR